MFNLFIFELVLQLLYVAFVLYCIFLIITKFIIPSVNEVLKLFKICHKYYFTNLKISKIKTFIILFLTAKSSVNLK